MTYVGCRSELDKYRMHFKLDLPVLELLGDYEMDGRALVLPIRGQGKANITVCKWRPAKADTARRQQYCQEVGWVL